MAMDYRQHLRKRFPYLEKAIDDKLAASEEFVTLCKDYVDAVNVLTRWEDSENPSVKTRALIVEYRHLVQNLEAEILFELYRTTN
ncbi:MAG TPA: hypothetical protein VGH13_26140 [Xanthobacteraceae bacterium]